MRPPYLSCLLVSVFVAAIVNWHGSARANVPYPGDSPIAGSKRLAPAPVNFFEGRLKAVPELAERAELEKKIFVPLDPIAYDEAEALPLRFRLSKERTGSGMWKLSEYYAGLSKTQFDEETPESSLSFFGSRIDKWQAERPGSPTPVIIKGMYLTTFAEAAIYLRSKTETITPEKLKVFNDRLEEARQYMLEHKAIGSSDPHWYSVTLRVMGYQCASQDELMQTLREGAGKYPDYYQMYFEAIYALRRCHRELSEFDEAVQKVAALGVSKTQATDNSGMYARTYWYASIFLPEGKLSLLPHYEWAKMKASFDDVIKRNGEAWNLNNFARFSCLENDREKMRELLPRVLDLPVVSVWGTPEVFASCWSKAQLSSLNAEPR